MPEKVEAGAVEKKDDYVSRGFEHLEMPVVEKVPDGEDPYYRYRKNDADPHPTRPTPKKKKPSAPPSRGMDDSNRPRDRSAKTPPKKKPKPTPTVKKNKKVPTNMIDYNHEYQYNPKDKSSKIHPGDVVLMNGMQCFVSDCTYDEDEDEQILSVRMPGDNKNKMVTRSDVLVLIEKPKIQIKETPGDPSRKHLIEELGQDCPARIVRSKKKFNKHWKSVYNEDPPHETMTRLLGRSIIITALDLGHRTARTDVDGDVMWIPRGCVILDAKPVFVLDEERSHTTPGGIPVQPPQKPSINLQAHEIIEEETTPSGVNHHHQQPQRVYQNHSQMSQSAPQVEEENYAREGQPKYETGVETNNVVVERHVRQVLGSAKIKVYGVTAVGEDRWAINGLNSDSAQELKGKQGLATAYDEKNDSYQCTIRGQSYWIPNEALLVTPKPTLDSQVRTTTENVAVPEGIKIEVRGEAPAPEEEEPVHDIFEEEQYVEPEVEEVHRSVPVTEPVRAEPVNPPVEAVSHVPVEPIEDAKDMEERKKAFAGFITNLGQDKLEKVLRKYRFASDPTLKQQNREPLNRDQVVRFEVELLFHAMICLYLEEVEKLQAKPKASGTKQFCVELATHLFSHHNEPTSVRVKDVIDWIMNKELLKIYCPEDYTAPRASRKVREAPKYNREPPKKLFISSSYQAAVNRRNAESKPVARVLSTGPPGENQQPIKQIRGTFHAVVTMSKETLSRSIREKGMTAFTDDEIRFWVGKRVQVKFYNPNNDTYFVNYDDVETWVPNDPAIKCLGTPRFENISPPKSLINKPKPVASHSVPRPIVSPTTTLPTPLSIVFTMNLDRLKTGMKNQNISEELLNTLRGKKSTSSATRQLGDKTMYEVELEGKKYWAPEDCLIVKRNPPPARSFSPNDRFRSPYGRSGGFSRI